MGLDSSNTPRPLQIEGGVRPVCKPLRSPMDSGALLPSSRCAGLDLERSVQERTDELVHSTRRMELLSNVASRLLATDDPQTVVNELCQRVLAFLNCDVFFNYIVEPASGRLHLNTSGGVSEEIAKSIEWLQFGMAVCGCVARDCERIVAEDIQHSGDPRAQLVRGMGVQAYACHPLVWGGRTMGTLSFGTRSRKAFSPDDLDLMKAVADHIAVAMERIESQQKLRDSEHRYRQLAESLPNLVWSCGTDGRCTYLNRRWVEYTGRPEAEQLGVGWVEQLHPEDRESTMNAWRRAVAGGEEFRVEFRLRRADGEYRWFDTRALPIRDANGQLVKWFGSNTDITDAKQLEQSRKELLEAERSARTAAEHANRMKDEFLATISHELRTPLQAILGWSGLLNSQMYDSRTAQAIEVIQRNARVQAQLIEDLLDMSRILNGKMRLDLKAVDLGTPIGNALKTVEPAAKVKQIIVHPPVECGPIAVQGDPDRLQQIVWNLLSNAIKFTPSGGEVRVKLEVADQTAVIRVADTGQGIKREFLAHVFDRFRQEDGSSTRRQGGLGIGLSIVRQLVEMHGGAVSVDSEGEGRGSTFTVRLPLAVEPAMAENAVKSPANLLSAAVSEHESMHTLQGANILLVDDQLDACILAQRCLEEAGAHVTMSLSARDALKSFASHPPHLLISDISMPEMDGYELIQEIRRRPAEHGGRVPAIALTAFARDEDIARCGRAGYQAHLAKPFEPAGLLCTVARILEEHLAVPPSGDALRSTTPGRAGPGGNGQHLKILLVEDYAEISAMLKLILEEAGHQVVVAGRIVDALNAAETEVFHLIISDLSLPDGSGLALMRTIRSAKGRNAATKAIALSGYDGPAYTQASLHAGFCEHLPKTIDDTELLNAIQRVMIAPTAAPHTPSM
jgi:PAS domain S-box-containing protein